MQCAVAGPATRAPAPARAWVVMSGVWSVESAGDGVSTQGAMITRHLIAAPASGYQIAATLSPPPPYHSAGPRVQCPLLSTTCCLVTIALAVSRVLVRAGRQLQCDVM